MLTPGETTSSTTGAKTSGASTATTDLGSELELSEDTGSATTVGSGASKVAVMAPLSVVTSALSDALVKNVSACEASVVTA